MSRYASDTSVPAEKSRAEIEATVRRYGADAFSYGWTDGKAVVQFRMNERLIRFILQMPDPHDREFTHTPSRGNARSDDQRLKAWEQATRQRWRALALVVKAKLEAVESGITTFEQEFGMAIVLPDGSTVSDHVLPAVSEAYRTGIMPSALLGLPERTGAASS